MITQDAKEFVLPSGVFCRLRPLRVRDRLLAILRSAPGTNKDFVVTLISLATSLDDKQATYEDILDLDLRDMSVIEKQINEFISGPVKGPDQSRSTP